MRPTQFRESWEYTVEKVAVNAVMAGARPEYFPVILALAASGVSGARQHHQLGGGDGRGQRPDPPRDRHELRASARWVRTTTPTRPSAAPTACCRRTCRAARSPGVTYMGSQGNNYAYNNLTFAENEERSPWEPFHVQHGFKADRQHGQRLRRLPPHRVHARPAREALARARPQHAARHGPARAAAVWCSIRSPRGSSSIAAASTPRTKLIDWIYENACMPAGEYWDYQLIQNYVYPRATFGEEPYAIDARRPPRRADPHVPAATRSTWWSSAARPTATGASSAPATARRSRSTTGGSARFVVRVAAGPPGRNTVALRDS